jgi:hypothetical protein
MGEGVHTLHLYETQPAFGVVWDNTWTITVEK